MIYLQLFWSFLQIGLFSFGGGYAAIPLIQGQIVDRHGWLSMPEFTDLVTISQMTPGPIAINSATFVGIKIAGGVRTVDDAVLYYTLVENLLGREWLTPSLFRFGASAPLANALLSAITGEEQHYF